MLESISIEPVHFCGINPCIFILKLQSQFIIYCYQLNLNSPTSRYRYRLLESAFENLSNLTFSTRKVMDHNYASLLPVVLLRFLNLILFIQPKNMFKHKLSKIYAKILKHKNESMKTINYRLTRDLWCNQM